MTELDALKIVRLGQLETFKNNLDAQSAAADVTFEQLSTPNSGMLSSYRFTKGSGANATTMTIDIRKDYVNNIMGIVAEDGEGNQGFFLKVNVAPTGDAAEYQYVDVSGLVEYLTVGNQTGKTVTLAINDNHQITADIADGAITKAKLATAVQNSLNAADTAYQKPATGIPATDLSNDVQTALDNANDAIEEKADKVASATNGNFAGLDAAGNLTDSGKKASDFQPAGSYKTTQSAYNATGMATDKTVATLAQNANGVISATFQSIQDASASQHGLMSAAHYSKLDAITYATDADINGLFA